MKTGLPSGSSIIKLAGRWCGEPGFPFTNAVSLVVNCESQEEIDHPWEKLAAIRIRGAIHASLKLALAGKRKQRAGCRG